MAGDVVRRIRIEAGNSEKVLKAVAAAADRASAATSRIQTAAVKVASSLPSRLDASKTAFEKFGAGVGGPIGGIIGQVSDLGEGMVSLAAATGPVGVVAGAAGVALLGMSTAFVAAGAAAVGLVYAAGQAAASLKEMKGIVPIDDAQIRRVEHANKAFDGLAVAAKTLTVTMGDSLAAPVRRIVTLSTAFVLALNDGIKVAGQFGAQLSWLVDAAFRPLDTAYAAMIKGTVVLLDLLGVPLPDAVRKSAESFEAMLRPTTQAATGITALELAAGGYLAQAEALNQSTAFAEHAKKVTDQAKEMQEAAKKAAEESGRHAQALEKTAEAAKRLAAIERDRDHLAQARRIEAERLARALDSGPGAQHMAASDFDRRGLATAQQFEAERLAKIFGQTLATFVPVAIDRAQGRRGMTGAGALGAVQGGASALASGSLSSLAALAGPVGAAVGAAVSTLQTLGEKGAQGVADALGEQTATLTAGIRAIPELLGKVVPKFVAEFVPALISALVESFPMILKEAFLLQFRLTAQLFTTLPESIGEAMGRALAGWWERAKDWIGLILTGRWREAMGGGGERTARERAGRAGRVGLGIATLGTSELAIRGGQGLFRGLGGDEGRRAWRDREDRGERGGVVVNLNGMVNDAAGFDKLMQFFRRNEGRRLRGG